MKKSLVEKLKEEFMYEKKLQIRFLGLIAKVLARILMGDFPRAVT